MFIHEAVKKAVETGGYFALLFEFDGDVKKRRHVLYSCLATPNDIESGTKGDKAEAKTKKISINATIKPAHLAVEYIFTYRLWQDILDEIQIWTTAKNYSWEWMLTFEVKSNLSISDAGVYYCPDGNGNGKIIWNNNKAYARRNE